MHSGKCPTTTNLATPRCPNPCLHTHTHLLVELHFSVTVFKRRHESVTLDTEALRLKPRLGPHQDMPHSGCFQVAPLSELPTLNPFKHYGLNRTVLHRLIRGSDVSLLQVSALRGRLDNLVLLLSAHKAE